MNHPATANRMERLMNIVYRAHRIDPNMRGARGWIFWQIRRVMKKYNKYSRLSSTTFDAWVKGARCPTVHNELELRSVERHYMRRIDYSQMIEIIELLKSAEGTMVNYFDVVGECDHVACPELGPDGWEVPGGACFCEERAIHIRICNILKLIDGIVIELAEEMNES